MQAYNVHVFVQYNGNTIHVPFLMELASEDELVNRLVTVIRDYSQHGDATISGDDQFDRWGISLMVI